MQQASGKVTGITHPVVKHTSEYYDIMKEELHQLAMPARVIWGTKDEIIPSAHAESLPPNVEVNLLEGYGHLVQLEAASEVNALLAS